MRELLAACVLLVIAASCGGSRSDSDDAACTAAYPDASLAEILSPPRENPWEARLDSAPDGGCERIRLRPIGPLRPLFNDSNRVQLEAARAIGISPIESEADAWRLSRPLVPVRSCRNYYVDELRHSYPYLVPEAARLLADIGRAFNDSLQARGGGAYRLKVTSLLRTPATVGRLRRVNRNASEQSTHVYGTTF
ncbi:MAG: hypothetical protein K2L99_06775, partial [Muribaculaceae bacterium]|nr:hypothetical protein [Muribaculaceae bacterium]